MVWLGKNHRMIWKKTWNCKKIVASRLSEFSEAMADSPVPQIAISGANIVAVADMTFSTER